MALASDVDRRRFSLGPAKLFVMKIGSTLYTVLTSAALKSLRLLLRTTLNRLSFSPRAGIHSAPPFHSMEYFMLTTCCCSCEGG
jgi:hypothetical protein